MERIPRLKVEFDPHPLELRRGLAELLVKSSEGRDFGPDAPADSAKANELFSLACRETLDSKESAQTISKLFPNLVWATEGSSRLILQDANLDGAEVELSGSSVMLELAAACQLGLTGLRSLIRGVRDERPDALENLRDLWSREPEDRIEEISESLRYEVADLEIGGLDGSSFLPTLAGGLHQLMWHGKQDRSFEEVKEDLARLPIGYKNDCWWALWALSSERVAARQPSLNMQWVLAIVHRVQTDDPVPSSWDSVVRAYRRGFFPHGAWGHLRPRGRDLPYHSDLLARSWSQICSEQSGDAGTYFSTPSAPAGSQNSPIDRSPESETMTTEQVTIQRGPDRGIEELVDDHDPYASSFLSRLFFSSAQAQWSTAGYQYVRHWVERLSHESPPDEEMARRHLEARLSAAINLRPAFESFKATGVKLLISLALIGLLLGSVTKGLTSLFLEGSAPAMITTSVSLGFLMAMIVSSFFWSRVRNLKAGVTLPVAGIALAIGSMGLFPPTVAWLTALLTGVVALFLVRLAARSWVPPMEEWPSDSDGWEAARTRNSVASDYLLLNFENAVVPYSSEMTLPLPVATLIAPEAFARRYPALSETAAELTAAEWDTYQRLYCGVADIIAPLRRATRACGADYILLSRYTDGIAIRDWGA